MAALAGEAKQEQERPHTTNEPGRAAEANLRTNVALTIGKDQQDSRRDDT
jgi:hypothetical protein